MEAVALVCFLLMSIGLYDLRQKKKLSSSSWLITGALGVALYPPVETGVNIMKWCGIVLVFSFFALFLIASAIHIATMIRSSSDDEEVVSH